MNPVQQAIGSVLGLDQEILTAQEEIRRAVREEFAPVVQERDTLVEQTSEFQKELEELRKAQESLYSSNALLQRQVDDLLWLDLSVSPSDVEEIIPTAKRKEMIVRLRRLRQENPIAKQAIKLTLRFVFGRGISYVVADKSEREIIDKFWNYPANKVALTSRNQLQQMFDDVLTDGEKFPIFGTRDAQGNNRAATPPHARIGEIPIIEVTDILYDPDNALIPVWYERVWVPRKFIPPTVNGTGVIPGVTGKWQAENTARVRYYLDYRITDEQLADIEARGLNIPQGLRARERVKHLYINPVKTKIGTRGVSELYASREWVRVFKEFMEDRGAINAAANALAFERKIAGTRAQIAAQSGRLGGSPVMGGDGTSTGSIWDRATARPAPGSILDTNNQSIQGIRADTGAPGAASDARMLLGAAGAGFGISINYLGDLSGASLAGAQAVELPMTKLFEDDQSCCQEWLQEIDEFVVAEATGQEIADVSPVQISWGFPPIVTQDVVKWITANAQMAQQITPGNRATRKIAIRNALKTLNVPNVEEEMAAIEAEDDRLFKEQQDAKEQAQKQAEMRTKAAINPPNPAANGNGKHPDGGQKAGGGPQGLEVDPSLTRMVAGRPPRDAPTGPRSRRQ